MTPCRQCQSGQNKNGFHRTFVGTSHCSRLVRRDRQIRNIKHLLGISFTDISILEAFSAFSLPNRNNERWSGFPLYLFGNAEFPPLSKSSSSFIQNHVQGFLSTAICRLEKRGYGSNSPAPGREPCRQNFSV